MLSPNASLVEIEIKSGFWFLKCALAAIKTGVSVIAFASFASVLPVHGKITKISKKFLGPIGSESSIVKIALFLVIFSAFSI